MRINVMLAKVKSCALIGLEGATVELRQFCQTEEDARSLLKAAMKQLHLSTRAFHRILKPALSIVDLENSDIIKVNHIAEAIQYRPRRTV